MADAFTAIVGAVIMVGYMYLIADQLDELPLWICISIGWVLMLYSFWTDAWRPLLSRTPPK